MNTAAGYIRPLGWLLAIALLVSTVLQLAMNLNLVATPPTFPGSATLVDRLLGSQDFRHAVWPFDLAANLLLCLGFVAAIPFTWLIGAGLDRSDQRRPLFTGLIVAGAIAGIVATLAYVGAVQVSIDTAYCDCGFKEQESISQFWAVSLAAGSHDWLLNGTALLIAAGLFVAGRALAATRQGPAAAAMPGSWATFTFVTAAALALGAILQIIGFADPLGPYTSALATGILLPIWSVWLARSFGSPAPA